MRRFVDRNTGVVYWADDEGNLVPVNPGLPNAQMASILSRLPDAQLAGYEGPGVVPSHRHQRGAKPDTLFIPGERIYFERSFTVPAVAASDPIFELHNPQDSGRRLGLVSVEIALATAVSTRVGLIYANQKGVPASSVTGMNVDSPGASGSTPSSTALVTTAWGTAPVMNTNYLKQQIAAVVGETILWSWFESLERPLIVPNGGSIVLREAAAAVTADMLINLRWVEMEVQR